MKEIVLFLQNMAAGGAERVALRLANYWASKGVNTTILLVRAEGALLRDLSKNVTIVDLQGDRTSYTTLRVHRYMRSRPGVPFLLFGIEVGRVAALARLLAHCDNMLIYREQTNPYANDDIWRRATYRHLINRVDRIIVQNETAKRALRSMGVARPQFFKNRNPVSESSKALDVESRLGHAGPRLVAVGRLVPIKGFRRLIEAMPFVLTRFREANLTIWGEGPQRNELQSLIYRWSLGHAVHLAGHSDSPEAIWRRADIYVLSSHYEGQPNALLEALNAGVPVVATSAGGGVKEILDEIGMQYALIQEQRFAHSLCAAISAVDSRSEDDFETVRRRFLTIFDWKQCVSAYDKACLGSA